MLVRALLLAAEACAVAADTLADTARWLGARTDRHRETR